MYALVLHDSCGMCLRYFHAAFHVETLHEPVAFQSLRVHVAIETQTRPISAKPVVLNQVHGASSLATCKGDYMTVWGL